MVSKTRTKSFEERIVRLEEGLLAYTERITKLEAKFSQLRMEGKI